MDLSRQQVLERVLLLDLDWGDEEDAATLLDLLLEVYSPLMAWTWLCFWCEELQGIPLELLRDGRGRAVFTEARTMIKKRVPV